MAMQAISAGGAIFGQPIISATSDDLQCHEESDDELTHLYDGVASFNCISSSDDEVDLSTLMTNDEEDDLLGCDEEIEDAFAAAEVRKFYSAIAMWVALYVCSMYICIAL